MTGSAQQGSGPAWTRPVSVVIPTYRRERVLVETLERVLGLEPAAAELLVVDQSEDHQAETEDRLAAWQEAGRLRWLRMARASIPGAMNRGLLEACWEIVLYLDDDVVPEADLIEAHWRMHTEHQVGLVAGRVIQPWDSQDGSGDRTSPFAADERRWVEEFIGANFSVKRPLALGIGGFDENFVKVAYRYEAEFSDRLLAAGQRILYEPTASVRHLKESSGGTRSFGDHLRTALPAHSVGEYYYLFRSPRVDRRVARVLGRLRRSIGTRQHLKRPWRIPVTLVAESLGIVWGAWLACRRPGTMDLETRETAGRD